MARPKKVVTPPTKAEIKAQKQNLLNLLKQHKETLKQYEAPAKEAAKKLATVQKETAKAVNTAQKEAERTAAKLEKATAAYHIGATKIKEKLALLSAK